MSKKKREYSYDITIDQAKCVIRSRDGMSNDFDNELAEAAYVLLEAYGNLEDDYKELQDMYWVLDAKAEQ